MTIYAPVVELFYGGAWVNITAFGHVYARDPITITRGRSDGAGAAEPSTCSLTINNRDGRYSPRNPLSPLYGLIGRNTPIRVTVNGVRRFWGEVSSWPARWDITATDAYAPISAAGILRRIGQGTQPVFSGLKTYLRTSGPVTYWPLDDGEGSTAGAPAAGTYTVNTFRPSSSAIDFGAGLLALHLAPTMRINDTFDVGFMLGECNGSDPAPDELAWDFVYKVQPTAGTIDTLMAEWNATLRVLGTAAGTSDAWSLTFRRDGVNDDIALTLFLDVLGASTTVNLGNTATLAALTDGALHHIRLSLIQDGADVDWAVYVDGASVLSGTQTTHTLRSSVHVAVDYDRTNPENYIGLGHLIVWENTIPGVTFVSGLVQGFAGETAGRRIERLCSEQDVPFVSEGDLDTTTPMGLLFEDYFSGQLAECEATDMGMLYEPRDQFALGYRTRESLYTQAATVTLDYTAGQLAPPFEPVEDDQNTRNDIFAQRREGSSYNATLDEGKLSVQDPPNGVGRYKDEVQLNPQGDAMLEGIAFWLLHLGTVDEPRYPSITVNLASPNAVALTASVLSVDIGDRIVITNARGLGIYEDVSLIVLGYTEPLNAFEHSITFNCSPESPYAVGEWGSGVATGPDRYDTAGSELATGVNATSTTLSVVDTGGTLWTTAASEEFDINCGGEKMRVTAVSGASSPQSFTVTRSVNGVVKSHASGTDVRLWRTPRYAL